MHYLQKRNNFPGSNDYRHLLWFRFHNVNRFKNEDMELDLDVIRENVKRIMKALPQRVSLVAAAKTRTAEEVNEAIQVGIQIIGYNYVQEAEHLRQTL